MHKTIACLPVAGIENPYQNLMIKGLNDGKKTKAFSGIDNRFFGIFLTWYKLKPDYIHFDWINSYYIRRTRWMTYLLLPVFLIQVIFLKYFTKTKIVWTLHNILPHNSRYDYLDKNIRSFFINKCHWVRVFSEDTVTKLSKTLRLKNIQFKIVPEGDYQSVYRNNQSREKSREILGLDDNTKVLLFLGFIRPYKGLEKLIEVFDSLNLEDTKLIIAGLARDNIYLEYLKNKVNKNKQIHFFDKFIKDNDLQTYFKASDLVILPFDNVENSGSVIMAMGFSKPIIAPKKGVLIRRLESQKSLLFDNNLGDVIKKGLTLSIEDLNFIGKSNKMSLLKYKWSDFKKCFE
ncbi:MAG: beta-1,4-mannosyltransferase [Flavobacteriaceae bacterium]|jgi:beta-1,4-mannosyltransferase